MNSDKTSVNRSETDANPSSDEQLRPPTIGIVHAFMFAVMLILVWVYLPLLASVIPIFIDQGWAFTYRGEQHLEATWSFTYNSFLTFGWTFGVGATLYLACVSALEKPVEPLRLASYSAVSALVILVIFLLRFMLVAGTGGLAGVGFLLMFFGMIYLVVAIPSIVLILIAESISDKLCGRTENSCVRAAVVLSIGLLLYMGIYAHLRQSGRAELKWEIASVRQAFGGYHDKFTLVVESKSFWIERVFMLPGKFEGMFAAPTKPVWGADGYYTPK